MSEEMIEKVRRAIISCVFGLTQPDRGDVFSWVDDHADEIAQAALSAYNPNERLREAPLPQPEAAEPLYRLDYTD